jgi:hypothetical protein
MTQHHPEPVPSTSPTYISKILPNDNVPSDNSGSFPIKFAYQNFVWIPYLHAQLLDLSVLTVLGMLYKTWDFSFCNALNCLLIWVFLDKNIFKHLLISTHSWMELEKADFIFTVLLLYSCGPCMLSQISPTKHPGKHHHNCYLSTGSTILHILMLSVISHTCQFVYLQQTESHYLEEQSKL